MRDWVAALPVNGEWWHPDNGDTYERLASELVADGLTEERAEEVLSQAYGAAADEFGS